MACLEPAGTISVPANSSAGGMRAGAHVNFYVPLGTGVVHYAFLIEPPIAGLHWYLTNAAGVVLTQGTPTGSDQGTWTLGQSDPHTIWFTTDANILGVHIGQTVAYDLPGACTSAQPPPCTAGSCPAGSTCVGGVCVPNSGGGGGVPPPPSGSSSLLVPALLVGGGIGAYWLLNRKPAVAAAGQARRRRRRR